MKMVIRDKSKRDCSDDDVEIIKLDEYDSEDETEKIEIEAYDGEAEAETETEDWCFVCKDGGKIRLCDHPNCGKSYHYRCVGQNKSFLKSKIDWNCGRHNCFRCSGRPTLKCYCCPKAICHQCLDAAEFASVGTDNGFCKECMKFVLRIEGITKQKLNYLSVKEKHFVEYYGITKKKHGFTLDNLQATKELRKSREKRKSSSSLDEVDENKGLMGLQTKKLESCSSQSDEVVTDIPAIRFASLVPKNVEQIYLTRSLVEKLLKQPESFEDKVKGTFVRVDLPQVGVSWRDAYQLVQVTGITKTSCDEDYMAIRLQAKNMPNGISIDMISNIDMISRRPFAEKVCKDLRQQVKDGLIEKPTVEKLARKARVLREDLIDDWIAKELRRLQDIIDRANEKGRKQELFETLYKKRELETPRERLRLIHDVPRVIAEELDVNAMSEEIVNVGQETEVSWEPVPTNGGQCTSNSDKISERSTNTVPIKNAFADNETILEIDLQELNADALDPRSSLKDMMGDEKQNEVSKSITNNLDSDTEKILASTHVKRQLGIIPDPVQEHVSKPVNEPVVIPPGPVQEHVSKPVNKPAGIPPVPLTMEIEKDSQQQFLAKKSTNEVIQQQNDKMDEELMKLRVEMQNNASISAAKIASLEEKFNHMFEQHMKQIKELQAEAAAEAVLSYKESEMFKADIFSLLEPVRRATYTKALEEVKGKHLPDLDLGQFPNYDPNAVEKVHPSFKEIVQSVMDVDFAPQQGATEEKCGHPALAQQPLTPQPPE